MTSRRLRTGALSVCILLTAAACSDDDGKTKVLDLAKSGAGTCLKVSDDLGAEVTALPVVGCDKEHTHEIYAVVAYDDGDVFPGLEALDQFAQTACTTAFQPYVGASNFDDGMPLTFTWLTPTLGSWNDEDDRDVLCVLANKDGSPLTKSMKAAFGTGTPNTASSGPPSS